MERTKCAPKVWAEKWPLDGLSANETSDARVFPSRPRPASRSNRPDTYQRLPIPTRDLDCVQQPVHTFLCGAFHGEPRMLPSGQLRVKGTRGRHCRALTLTLRHRPIQARMANADAIPSAAAGELLSASGQ
jgi:hypothetical protein